MEISKILEIIDDKNDFLANGGRKTELKIALTEIEGIIKDNNMDNCMNYVMLFTTETYPCPNEEVSSLLKYVKSHNVKFSFNLLASNKEIWKMKKISSTLDGVFQWFYNKEDIEGMFEAVFMKDPTKYH